MKILVEETKNLEILPAYKNFMLGSVCVEGKKFTLKMKWRSPQQICNIQQKWNARVTRNKIGKHLGVFGCEKGEGERKI